MKSNKGPCEAPQELGKDLTLKAAETERNLEVAKDKYEAALKNLDLRESQAKLRHDYPILVSLGEIYIYLKEYQKAYECFRPAAEQGDAKAQSAIGNFYFHGRGVKKDYAEAKKWYEKAIEQGNAKAQLKLGSLYRDGKGVKRDYVKALKWYLKAVKQGGIGAKAESDIKDLYESASKKIQREFRPSLIRLADKGQIWAMELLESDQSGEGH